MRPQNFEEAPACTGLPGALLKVPKTELMADGLITINDTVTAYFDLSLISRIDTLISSAGQRCPKPVPMYFAVPERPNPFQQKYPYSMPLPATDATSFTNQRATRTLKRVQCIFRKDGGDREYSTVRRNENNTGCEFSTVRIWSVR